LLRTRETSASALAVAMACATKYEAIPVENAPRLFVSEVDSVAFSPGLEELRIVWRFSESNFAARIADHPGPCGPRGGLYGLMGPTGANMFVCNPLLP